MDDLGENLFIFGNIHDGFMMVSWTTPKRGPAWISAGDAEGWVSYDDFAERTKKHGQRRVFEAPGDTWKRPKRDQWMERCT